MDNFQKKLETLINQTNQEKGSNTPDFILAEFLTKMQNVFDYTVNKRDKWYGMAPHAGRWIKTIRDIQENTPEGRLLMAALSILTTENWTNITPDDAVKRLEELATHMQDLTPEQSQAQPLSWKPNEERDELKNGCVSDKQVAACELNRTPEEIHADQIKKMFVQGFKYTFSGLPGKILQVDFVDRPHNRIDLIVYPIGESENSPEAFRLMPALDAEIFNFKTGKNKPVKEAQPGEGEVRTGRTENGSL